MRKKRRDQGNAVMEINDTKATANDFILRRPFGRYTPCAYRVTGDFALLKSELDECLDRLFKGIDEGNADVLDQLIMDAARKAHCDLQKQKGEHAMTINDLCDREAGDYLSFCSERDRIAEDLSETLKAQEKLIRRLDRDEFRKEED